MAYAHTPNRQGKWHDLVEHLSSVANLARDFATAFDGGEPAYRAGLWHDVGKFNPAFQEYLHRCAREENRRGRGPDHKTAGMLLAARFFQLGTLVIQGHHGGLRTLQEVKSTLAERSQHPEVLAAIASARAAISDLEPSHLLKLPQSVERDPLAAELWLRMVFSALVDADYLDTERHFDAETAANRGAGPTLAELQPRFERNRQEMIADRDSPVAQLRDEIYASCITAAATPPGIFRLTVPTGGGKTLSAMGFALEHARLHGHRRVIVAVPYISITQQTAAVYRRAFADDDESQPVVLEHHSAAIGASEDGEDFHACHVWERLAAENWDAPVIVTTTVQLFESLFAAGTSRCRKLHRLANSIIIIDEAQALPASLLEPMLDVLRRLATDYGATIVLSTATQPAFSAITAFREVKATEVVPDFERYFASLRRVRYEWRVDEPVDWLEIAELVRSQHQVLAVVNTKRDALALLDAIDDPDALHLSTLLCGAHRTRVIEEVRRRLKSGEPCRLISTQVVEAGVDLDFPVVLRALGPLDSIIQAAGRCNREGRLDRGRVIIFRPAEGGLPLGLYRSATQITEALRAIEPANLDDRPDLVERYFRTVYATGSPDEEGIQQLRQELNFPEVDRRFRLIKQDTESLIVRYSGSQDQTKLEECIAVLRNRSGNARLALRRLQPFMVTVYRNQAERFRRENLIEPIMPGVGIWLGEYDPVRGLTGRDLPPDQLVV